jgi:pyruvate/2-oxoglutarate/acetoin dehydrogenase E1 component
MKSIRYVESLNSSLHYLMQEDDTIFIIGEDIADPYGGAFKVTNGLSTKYPQRVLTTPISEAAIMGFASGLAMRGFKPILEIMFGDFITLCTDQIVNGISKFHWMYGEKIDVPLVVRTPMGGYRGYGPTHSQSLESLFLSVPGIDIVAPTNYHDPGKMLISTVLDKSNPTLFIENKVLYSQKLKKVDKEGKIDEWHVQVIDKFKKTLPTVSLKIDKERLTDVTLITYGGVSSLAVSAALETYLEEELNVEVLIVSSLKPLPLCDLLPSIKESGRVVVLEEGVKTSGWGAELACSINENCFSVLNNSITRLGALELPIPSSKSIEDVVLPQVEDIVKALLDVAQ